MSRWTNEDLAKVHLARRRGLGDCVEMPRPLEREVLPRCLEALPLHRNVAWFARMNVGALEIDDRTIRFAFTGCSDIIGQLRTGQFLAVECKRPGEEPTDDQAEFLWKVWSAGGCAFVATDASDIFRNIPR